MDELIALLEKANGRPDDQRTVTLSLARFNSNPHAPHLYMRLFCDRQYSAEMRGMAGLLLKNVLKRRHNSSNSNSNGHVGEWAAALCQVITGADEPAFVVSTASTILAVLMAGHVDLWPQVMTHLLTAINASQHLDGNSNSTSGGVVVTRQCLMAVERVLEELAGCGTDDTSVTSYDGLWSICLALMADPNSKVLALCLRIVNHLLYINGDNTDTVDIDALLVALSRCAVSPDPQVKRLVCTCLSVLSECYDQERMAPSVPAIQSFMWRALQEEDTAVALEACEYWNAAAERGIEDGAVIAKLVPVLVQRVIYDPDDPDIHNLNVDTTQSGGSGDVKPRHHHHHYHHSRHDESNDSLSDSQSDSSDDDDYSEWTLRKCAASTIDFLSSGTDQAAFLQVLLPCCQQLLSSTDSPLHREAAILLLGAVAQGCKDGLRPHLPALLPFIIDNVNTANQHPLVVSIAVWTLSRFHWFIQGDSSLLSATMAALLHRLRECGHVKTRRAVCSSLAVFCGEADVRFCAEMLAQSIAEQYPSYSNVTLPNLLDLIASLADSVTLGQAGVALLRLTTDTMSQSSPTTDGNVLYAVMEAIACLCNSIGDPIVVRQSTIHCYNVAIMIVQSYLQAADNKNTIDIDVEMAAAAVDLLGAVVRGSKYGDGQLVDLLFACTGEPVLLQSACAVLGDIASSCPQSLAGHVDKVSLLLMDHFDPNLLTSEVSSNAIWAFGCLCDSNSIDNHEVIGKAVSSLSRLLMLPNQSRSFYDNVVVALGKALGRCSDHHHEIGAALPRFTKLASVSRDDDCLPACVGMLTYLNKHAGQFLPKWPVEAVRIALCCPPDLPLAQQVVAVVRDNVVGRERWPGWRKQHLPDIPLSRLPN